jgi:pyruvate-formate lyase
MLAREAAAIYCREVEKHRNYRGGFFQPGIYSMSSHLVFGMLTGATPDGRHKGDSLAVGVSPYRGRELKGPTAVMRSVATVDGTLVSNGYVLNMSFNPHLIKGDENLRKFAELNRAYFKLGGLHVQYNIIDAEILREAQKHPEMYRGMVVRVAGYSALFTELDRATQNDIINRTAHGCER